jgi:hypothetical protein
MAIADGHKTNFETIQVAVKEGDACLLEVYDRITGEEIVMLCATYKDEEENINFVPLARMVDSDPYDSYVTEKENVAKYYGVGESVARTADRSFLNTIKDVPFIEEPLAKAYAILKDHLNDGTRAEALAHKFVEEILDKAGEEWSLSALELDAWVMHAEGHHVDENTVEGLRAVHGARGSGEGGGLVNPFGQPISSGKSSSGGDSG